MKILGLIWLEDIVEKLWRKHHVRQSEVEEIFENDPYFRYVENGDRPGEDLYSAMSQTDGGRYLIVFFIYKKNRWALIVSTRKMEPEEKKIYEER